MNKICKKKRLSLIVCIVLIAAMALSTTGCNGKTPAQTSSMEALAGGDIGEGATTFTFTVTDLEGNDTVFTVHTDKTTVGEALAEVGLIGNSLDGLYTTVNGDTYEYTRDGKYWAFYENGTYAMTGADQTKIQPDTAYAFKVE